MSRPPRKPTERVLGLAELDLLGGRGGRELCITARFRLEPELSPSQVRERFAASLRSAIRTARLDAAVTEELLRVVVGSQGT